MAHSKRTVRDQVREDHNNGTDAIVLLNELVSALAEATIVWGCDPDEIIELYKEVLTHGQGKGSNGLSHSEE